jgi:hypothetical protein
MNNTPDSNSTIPRAVQVRNHWTNQVHTMTVKRVTSTMIVCSDPLNHDSGYQYQFNRFTGAIGTGRSTSYSIDPVAMRDVISKIQIG